MGTNPPMKVPSAAKLPNTAAFVEGVFTLTSAESRVEEGCKGSTVVRRLDVLDVVDLMVVTDV
jgi:hypothetical protein